MARNPAQIRHGYLQPLIALIAIVAILFFAKPVIVPLVLAILLAFALNPVIAAIQQRGLKRVPAVSLTVFFVFVLFGVGGWAVADQLHSLARELPTHRKEIDAKLADLRGGAFSDLLRMVREIAKGETKAAPNGAEAHQKEKVVIAEPQETSSFEQVATAAGPMLEPLAQAGFVIILVIFMLIKREDLRNRFIGLLGHGRLTGTTRILVDAAQRLSRFLLSQLLINLGFGIVFAIGLLCIGVPYAYLWGLLATFLRFIPYIGSWVALGFPLVLSFAISIGWTQPMLVLALFAVLEVVTANVIEPIIFGHGTGVSPIALLVAAAFWAWLWGPIGLVLSTPMTVCLVTLGQHVPRFQFLAVLLGNEPALEPHVSFYQRLLARDVAEAHQVAVAYATVQGQEKVYDDVLLPALELARRDRLDAGLDAEDERFIAKSVSDSLEDLATKAAPQTPAAATDAAPTKDAADAVSASPVPALRDLPLIFACPAYHEVEELTLAMLAQLLKPSGYRLEAATTKTLLPEIERRIRQEKPAIIFIAVLPGGIVQAQYLCKRLRKSFADLPIIVGCWGDERQFDKILIRLRSAGASYVTTSLLQSCSRIRALVAPPVIDENTGADDPTPAVPAVAAPLRSKTKVEA